MFFILFFETRSLTESGTHQLARLAGLQDPEICLLLLAPHWPTDVHHRAEFFLSSEGPASGPHAGAASALPTKPSIARAPASNCLRSVNAIPNQRSAQTPFLVLVDPYLAPRVSQRLWWNLGDSGSQWDDQPLGLATEQKQTLRAKYRLGNRKGKTYFLPVHFSNRLLPLPPSAAGSAWSCSENLIKSHSAEHAEFQEARKPFLSLEVV